LDLDEDLVALLQESNASVPSAVLELTVMELYRRGSISGGKAAQLLGMTRLAFIYHAANLGIPYFNLAKDDRETERAFLDTL
jgi:predicted HTH domain antitoxin